VRRLRRWILKSATTLSALLLAATAAMWVRSYFVYDSAGCVCFVPCAAVPSEITLGSSYEVCSDRGCIVLLRYHGIPQVRFAELYPDLKPTKPGWYRTTQHIPQRQLEGPPFGAGAQGDVLRERGDAPLATWWGFGVPFWVLAAFFFIPSVALLHRALQTRSHRAPGLCRKCGYDLRATPDRCPECGMVTSSRA